MRSIIRVGCALAFLFAPTVTLAGQLWCSRFPLALPCPRLNPDNNHYYALVSSGETAEKISWEAAKDEAATFTFHGVPGHLATITSAAEGEFLKTSHLSAGNRWIGASDREVEGEWRWMVGPEAGELFWLGGVDGAAVGYADWAPQEPNNLLGAIENYAVWGWNGEFQWNDLPNHGASYTTNYLIEFSVPEPNSYVLTLLGTTALIGYAQLRKTCSRGL